MLKKSKLEIEDLVALYDSVWGQLKEDRTAVVDQYEHLKKYIVDTPDRYMTNGDTLAKYAELMVKQTAQVIELLKIASKQTPENDDGLNENDLVFIAKEINE